MKKIPSVFQRNYDTDRLIRDEVVPGCEWVLAGEGYATRKWDGTCCLVRGGKLFKRYELKKGKPAPEGFEPAQEPDPKTGDVPGWVPVGDGPEDRWHIEAFERCSTTPKDGTYELVGPRINGNPEGFAEHRLIPHGMHGAETIFDFPRDFAGIREWLARNPKFEGVVFHHPDGRMAKVKGKDFGFRRGVQSTESSFSKGMR